VTAPDDINGFFAFLNVPSVEPFPVELHGRTVCGVVWCSTASAEGGERNFARIRRAAGGPIFDLVGPMPLPVLQSMFDPFYPPGLVVLAR
jgi:hypothetical protein